MAITKIIDPDSSTADRPKQVTGHSVDDRVGQDVYIIGGLTLTTLESLIGDLSNPAAGSVNKQLANILTKFTDGLQKTQTNRIHPTPTKIIDAATITQSVTGADIDISGYSGFAITYNLGAGAGGTPTLTLTVQVKDVNGNYITDNDYSSAALAASSSGVIKGYFESYGTIRVIATLGGTGTFAASTVAVELKS